MKNSILFLGSFIIINIVLNSCDKEPLSEEPSLNILKFKEGKDYSNNVFVLLSDDKNTVKGYPGYQGMIDIDPLDSYKGYYLELPNYGESTAYLNLTKEEYKNVPDTFNKIAIEDLIIDKDPYAEFYVDKNKYLVSDEKNKDNYWLKENKQGLYDTIWNVYDTAKFHRLVDNGELEKYLKRLK